MASDREIVLEQALVAVVAEAKAMGIDLVDLRERASKGLYGNKSYRWVMADKVTGAVGAIEAAVAQVS